MLLALLLLTQVLSRPPELLEDAPVEVPESAWSTRPEAELTVGVAIELTAMGEVRTASVVDGVGEPFDSAAASAVSRFRFRAAEAEGAPVAVSLVYRLTFSRPLAPVVLTPAPATTASLAVDEERVLRGRAEPGRASSVRVSREEARRVPGTAGDPVKVLEALPGVGRPPLGTGALSVWGAAPDETRVLLDGVEIPALYHLGGLRSILGPELIDRVELTPAGQGAAFGRGVGGLVEVETVESPPSVRRAILSADLLDVGALLESPLGPDAGVSVSGRQSILDAIVPAVSTRDPSAIVPLPTYRDVALQVGGRPTAGHWLDLLLLGSFDRLDRRVEDPDPVRAQTESRVQELALVRARWRIRERDRTTTLIPSLAWSRRTRTQRTGGVDAREDVGELRVGLRGEHRAELGPRATLIVGLDALATFSDVERSGSLTIPPREGDPNVFGRVPSDAIASDAWQASALGFAPHVSTELRAGALAVTPGLRLELVGLGVSRVTPRAGDTPQVGGRTLSPRLQPRLAVSWAPWPELLRLRGAAGLYVQAPEPEALSAVSGNPRLGLAEGAHGTLSAELTVARGLQLEAAGFVRSASGLVARGDAQPLPLTGALTDTGEARALGAQLTVRLEPPEGDGPSGWASYTLLRSERRADGGSAWRRADFDRTHALVVVGGYRLGSWNFGLRLRWTSGAPYTAVVGRYLDVRRDVIVPLLGPVNEATLPPFFQLDLRAERAFALGPGTLTVSLELENATATSNVEQPAYRGDYLESRPITGLPFLAVLGVRWVL